MSEDTWESPCACEHARIEHGVNDERCLRIGCCCEEWTRYRGIGTRQVTIRYPGTQELAEHLL